MWPTGFGDRVLTGAEGELFHRLALGFSEEVIESCLTDGEKFRGGAGVFDKLTLEQQVVTLSVVIPALLDPDVPCDRRDLTACNEAAIFGIYRFGEIVLEEEPAKAEGLIRRALSPSWVEGTETNDEVPGRFQRRAA